MPTLTEQSRDLRQRRAKAINDARAILEAAEGRELTQEEQNSWDAHMGEAEKLYGRIERLERQAQADGEIAAPANSGSRHQASSIEDVRNLTPEKLASMTGEARARVLIPEALHKAFGIASVENEMRQLRQYEVFKRYLPVWVTGDYRKLGDKEMRALQQDLDVSGGYLVPPEQFMNELIKNIDDLTYIRQWATTFTVTNADGMGVPTLENDPADADWTTELATGSEDSTMSFGKRELRPHPLAKRIKVSKKLMRSVPSAETFVRGRLAYKFGITHEKAAMTGTGAGQMLGLFTASNDGIPTSRDFSTGNTTTSITFDGLYEAKYALKMQYWPRARWLFHRDGVKQIAKLVDGEGQYLWQESTRVGEPDRIAGLPVFMSEYAPNTFTASQYVGLLGDFSNYWIVDALTLEFQLLTELYAETNQVGMIGRMESDGQPVLAEAFARVKLAAG